jgi:hypothetical protein
VRSCLGFLPSSSSSFPRKRESMCVLRSCLGFLPSSSPSFPRQRETSEATHEVNECWLASMTHEVIHVRFKLDFVHSMGAVATSLRRPLGSRRPQRSVLSPGFVITRPRIFRCRPGKPRDGKIPKPSNTLKTTGSRYGKMDEVQLRSCLGFLPSSGPSFPRKRETSEATHEVNECWLASMTHEVIHVRFKPE